MMIATLISRFRSTLMRRHPARRRPLHTERVPIAGPSFEPLETRNMMSLTVNIDYSLDTNGFFDEQLRRDVFEAAVDAVAGNFLDTLTAIVPGGPNSWTQRFFSPSTGNLTTLPGGTLAQNEIIIYAGGRSLGGALGVGGPGSAGVSFGGAGGQAFVDNVNSRGQSGALLSTETDFGPWGGSVSFELSTNWHFGLTTAGLDMDEFDFYSVAVHELLHMFGFGTADSFHALEDNDGFFTGPQAVQEYDFEGLPALDGGGSHWVNGTQDGGQETAMDPSLLAGTRKLATALDLAAMADLGWQISGFLALDDAGASYTTDENTAFNTPNVLLNDTSKQSLSITGFDTTGTLGTVTDNGNGTFHYDPAGAFNGLNPGESGFDQFTYTVNDGHGAVDTAIVMIEVTGVAGPNQIVSAPAALGVRAGDPFAFNVSYDTSNSDNTTDGLTLRMHFDSSRLTFDGLTNTLNIPMGDPSIQVVADSDDLDGDASTDMRVEIVWSDGGNAWPGVTLPATLFTANFTLDALLANDDTTIVNFTGEPASGFALETAPVTVTVTAGSLDVDADGTVQPLTDGILIIRYLAGFTGTVLTTGALGNGAARTDPLNIMGFLDALRNTMLDADLSGDSQPLTDGILIIRHLAGFTGTVLTSGAVSGTATRTDPTEIGAFLDTFIPMPAPPPNLPQYESLITLESLYPESGTTQRRPTAALPPQEPHVDLLAWLSAWRDDMAHDASLGAKRLRHRLFS
ncbi:MAG: hypothetical protein GC159_16910 [Phycisphaera sp.]|nr:hypothetical protein [Phycisphaera sp.]